MGADYYSMTVIGLKVPKDNIMNEIELLINRCSCNPQTPNSNTSIKYCQHCGNLLNKSIKVEKPLFDEFNEDYLNEENTICSWPITYDTDAHNFYVCIYNSGHVEREKRSNIPCLSERIISKFKTDMKSVNLWDEEQFGLWTITYCSY